MKQLNSRGDTIVEVLITIIVVSSALVGAIATSNYGVKQIRMAQERTEAQKIAQQEIEKLDTVIAKNKPTLLIGTGVSDFCISPTFTMSAVSSPECKRGNPNRYEVVISRDDGVPKTFKVTVKWKSLKGGDEFVSIPYRTGILN